MAVKDAKLTAKAYIYLTTLFLSYGLTTYLAYSTNTKFNTFENTTYNGTDCKTYEAEYEKDSCWNSKAERVGCGNDWLTYCDFKMGAILIVGFSIAVTVVGGAWLNMQRRNDGLTCPQLFGCGKKSNNLVEGEQLAAPTNGITYNILPA